MPGPGVQPADGFQDPVRRPGADQAPAETLECRFRPVCPPGAFVLTGSEAAGVEPGPALTTWQCSMSASRSASAIGVRVPPIRHPSPSALRLEQTENLA